MVEWIKERDNDITQLQRDILDQNMYNKEQQEKIEHLEKLVEDLTDKVGKAEEQRKSENATTQRTTRSAVASQSEKQLANTLKALEAQTQGMEERI
jgi:chemotaxis response regulator CheB